MRRKLFAACLLLGVGVLGNPEINSYSAANEYDSGYNIAEPLIVSVPPLLKCGRNLAGLLTYVALGVLVVIVLVACGSGLITYVTILVAIVVVGMGDASGLLTYVTLGIAVVVVFVSGFSGGLTNVALLVAGVIVLVGSGSGGSANVTVGIALVVKFVGDASGSLTNVALGIAGVVVGVVIVLTGRNGVATFAAGRLISENGYSGHSAQYGKNCQNNRKKGKILLHR